MAMTQKLRSRVRKTLPLGSIKPKGWLKQQLQIQANGLSGHLDEIWDDVGPDNRWFGGEKEGWERGPYYADGLLPLAYLLDDERLKEKAQKWVDAFFNGQEENGWIGPKQGANIGNPEYDPWPIFIVFKVLKQYFEVSQDEKVLKTMLRFCRYLQTALPERPLSSWAMFRWADMLYVLQWLYEITDESFLLDVMATLQEQGYNWSRHWQHFRYKKKQPVTMETHVVNNAMGLKTSVLWSRNIDDYSSEHDAFYSGLTNLDTFHGQVTGIFSGDEHFSGRNPSQGTELCAVVEYMFSLECALEVLDDPSLVDRLEKITFNALPATFKPDMWAHQYDQQANQPLVSVGEKPWSNEPDANIFGLEPNFGCCTANMHQGWPKFLSSLWLQEGEGLTAAAYGPCEVQATLPDGTVVTIEESTEYPFRESIAFNVTTSQPTTFPLRLRIPEWALDATVAWDDGSIDHYESGTYALIERTWEGTTTLVLQLPRRVVSERRHHGSISLLYGPLVLALKIPEEWQLLRGTPPYGDWEVFPKVPWNYGLVLNNKTIDEEVQLRRQPLQVHNPPEAEQSPFSPAGAPLLFKVPARLVPQWALLGNLAGEIPASPIVSREPMEEITLIPYGCTNLRISEFPLVFE